MRAGINLLYDFSAPLRDLWPTLVVAKRSRNRVARQQCQRIDLLQRYIKPYCLPLKCFYYGQYIPRSERARK